MAPAIPHAPAAIVTGGGSGIGRAAAAALAARGARVLIVDLDRAAAEETAGVLEAVGGTVAVVECDVTDAGAAPAYVAECERLYGGVDAFFNNAAHEGAIAEVADYPLEELDRTLAVNVRGAFLGLKHVIPAMRRRGGGSIVNTASQAGIRGVAHFSAYAASKHAVVGLTRSSALELARDTIRVNAVCPGPTDTSMMKRIEAVLQAAGETPALLERMPIGRLGQPEEIAALVTWLLLDAPAFLTGAVISIDGGLTAL